VKLLKLLQLAQALYGAYEILRRLPPNRPTMCEAVKVRIDGRLYRFGPFPAERLE
jgi:hypothetical protein